MKTKYKIICPKCKNTQVYIPKGDVIVKSPHTLCSSIKCRKQFYFKKQLINKNIISEGKTKTTSGKTTLNKSEEWILKANKLSPELLENLLLNELKYNRTPQMVRSASEFYIKIMHGHKEKMEDIDFEYLLKKGEGLGQESSIN